MTVFSILVLETLVLWYFGSCISAVTGSLSGPRKLFKGVIPAQPPEANVKWFSVASPGPVCVCVYYFELTAQVDIKGEKGFFGNPDWDPETRRNWFSLLPHVLGPGFE